VDNQISEISRKCYEIGADFSLSLFPEDLLERSKNKELNDIHLSDFKALREVVPNKEKVSINQLVRYATTVIYYKDYHNFKILKSRYSKQVQVKGDY